MNQSDAAAAADVAAQAACSQREAQVETVPHESPPAVLAAKPGGGLPVQPPTADAPAPGQEEVAGPDRRSQQRHVADGPDATEPLAERVDHTLDHILDRIRTHPDLTPGMRQRLAEAVQRQPPAEGPLQIPLAEVMAILAESLPSHLRLDAGELPTAPHPEGESFFSGDPAADADQRAAAIAREQLALSGLVRR
jgi:hypothetical protein